MSEKKTIKVEELIEEYKTDRIEAIQRYNQIQQSITLNQQTLNNVQMNLINLNQSLASETNNIIYINKKLEGLGIDLNTLANEPERPEETREPKEE